MLGLEGNGYYRFIINNENKLKKDIESLRYNSDEERKDELGELNETEFKIPETDIVYLDMDPKILETPIESNVYKDYTVKIEKSIPERIFERDLCKLGSILWYYKNGDKGKQYFSIAYLDNMKTMYLFYPDYLVMTRDNRLFIIEIKGGEDLSGNSLNDDKMAPIKFDALSEYVKKHNSEVEERKKTGTSKRGDRKLYFAFVRNKKDLDESGIPTDKLVYSNTKWTEKIGGEWKSFEGLFKEPDKTEG